MGLLTDSKSKKKMSAVIVHHSDKLIVLCFLIGVVWFCLLASDVLNSKTYFSENALLPGLVNRAFNPRSSLSRRLDTLKEEAAYHPFDLPSVWILSQFRQLGLDVYQNNFSVQYPFGNKVTYKGNNLYAILRAPKIASTEAIVISTPYRDYNNIHESTLTSIALMIELAHTFRKNAYWSKDIIFLITQHENLGFQAWLDAYHSVSTSNYIVSEKLKSTSGLIQGVVNLEVSSSQFSHLDIKIEGLHGQLPNLDLFNLVVELCNREEIPTSFHSQFNYYPNKPITWDNWKSNFITMVHMMSLQASGLPTGGHGLFHRFGIQALTVKSVNRKTNHPVNLLVFGRVLEGIIRSLNNLLEKFHQSFFFYLLPTTRSYISIGLYMPPFALIALPILIKALYLYLSIQVSDLKPVYCVQKFNYLASGDIFTVHLFYSLVLLIFPIYIDNVRYYVTFPIEDVVYYVFLFIMTLWFLSAYFFNSRCTITVPEFYSKMCLVLLMLGGFLYTMALVNIALALFISLLYVPASVMLEKRGKISVLQHIILLLVHPFVLTFIVVVIQSHFLDTKADWWTHIIRSIGGHKKLLLYTLEDMYFFGNWNYKIATFITAMWFSLWSLKINKL